MVALLTPPTAAPVSHTYSRNTTDLTNRIDSRTFRQVRNLRVVQDADRIVLHGCSESYYVKQLATHAVLDMIPGISIENRIDVTR